MSENYDPIDSLVSELKGNTGFLDRLLFPKVSIRYWNNWNLGCPCSLAQVKDHPFTGNILIRYGTVLFAIRKERSLSLIEALVVIVTTC